MAVTIPVSQNASYSIQVEIEDVVYTLRFNWNSRGEFWTIDILDIEDTVLVAGVKLVVTYPLLTTHQYREIPQGGLTVVDPSDLKTRLARNDLGNRAVLLYLTEEEVNAV